ncbi:DUF222 domain-containing protein, partial [Rhodococcus sp. NPDC058514]|uniref:DUF222 domain-containing protein n=1 Tax=Rhodococcus sp. NPDC058514 TaxID=3346532 RepID=UPI0036588897
MHSMPSDASDATPIGDAATADAITAALRDLESATATLRTLNYQMLPNPDRIQVLTRLETIARTLPALGHTLINQLVEQRACDTLGGTNLRELLANTLHISPTAASERIHVAHQLGSRTAFDGQPLDPEMPATAAAAHQGEINPAHVDVIRTFLRHLPDAIDQGTRDQAERDLAEHARTLRPDELKVAAERLA